MLYVAMQNFKISTSEYPDVRQNAPFPDKKYKNFLPTSHHHHYAAPPQTKILPMPLVLPDQCTSNMEWDQFLPSCILPVTRRSCKYALSHQLFHRLLALRHQPTTNTSLSLAAVGRTTLACYKGISKIYNYKVERLRLYAADMANM